MNQPTPNWETEFNEKWRLYMGDCNCNKEAFFKPFIRTLLAKERAEAEKQIGKNRISHKKDCCEWWGGCNCVLCECISLYSEQEKARAGDMGV